ncbi:MAG: PEP-CTERM sorting domain-containing protein [Rhodospirillales bacterium]|nr:PEP-CTERM sorting domain-containing protein [Rhodospirillales bacterium]
MIQHTKITLAIAALLSLTTATPTLASITDFNTWTLAEDPQDPNLSASVEAPNRVRLVADGAVPDAVDIGYQSVDGNTPAESTSGFAFDPTASFSLAVDYDFSLINAVGGIGIGFGIGEDGTGNNSAGVALGAPNGGIMFVGGAARTDNANETLVPIGLGASVGSMHVIYDAVSGDITVGTGGTGADVPTAIATFVGSSVYDLWNADGDDDLLLAALFIRSDDTAGAAFTSGTATAIFSNLRVTGGSPVAVPEPASLALLGLGGLLLTRRQRKSLHN